MRTRITCNGRVTHAGGHNYLWRNAELVYDGNTVLFIGEHFEGTWSRGSFDARDKLVAPGSSTPMCIPAIAPRTG